MKIVCSTLAIVMASISLSPSVEAGQIALSDAFDYNAFIIGDYTGYKSDVEGTLAVGGNLTVSDFDIGLQLSPNLTTSSLYVGGNTNYVNGTIHHGQTTVNGNLEATGVTFEGDINAVGNVSLSESKVTAGDINSQGSLVLQNAEVVNGNVSANNLVQNDSSVNSGNVSAVNNATLTNSEITSGTLSATTVSLDGDSTANSVVTTAITPPIDVQTIDFDKLANEVIAQSLTFADMAVNGATQVYCGGETNCDASNIDGIVFSGSESINVYAIDAASLSAANKSITYDFSTTSYNIINVFGDSVELFNTGFYNTAFAGQYVDNNPAIDYRHDGTYTNNILFNFLDATDVSLHSVGVKGSVLAPFANVSFYNGQIDGNLIAASLSTPEILLTNDTGDTYLAPTGQVNNYRFAAIQVSEPTSGFMLLLASLLMLKRRGLKGKP